jgi:hypothetical protein
MMTKKMHLAVMLFLSGLDLMTVSMSLIIAYFGDNGIFFSPLHFIVNLCKFGILT